MSIDQTLNMKSLSQSPIFAQAAKGLKGVEIDQKVLISIGIKEITQPAICIIKKLET
jgi:hypothetical protein